MSSLDPVKVIGVDSSRSICSGMPACPSSLGDRFVSHDGTESPAAGMLQECGPERAAISLPQPDICLFTFLSPAAERGQSPPCQHAIKLQCLNQSSLPAERDGNVTIR